MKHSTNCFFNKSTSIEIKPKTVMSSDFSFTAVRFSCRMGLIDKLKLLFHKYIWFEISSNDIHRLNGLALQDNPEIDIQMENK